MKNKIINIASILIVCVTTVIACINICFEMNNRDICDFLSMNYYQFITIIVAVGIAFLASQFKSDQRKRKEHAEEQLVKLKDIVTKKEFYIFKKNEEIEEHFILIEMTNRKLSNIVNILSKYSKEFDFVKEIEYINKEITDYKDFVSEHISDIDYLIKSKNSLSKHSNNIDFKCDEIIEKIYR